MKRFDQGSFKTPDHLMYAFVLGYLEPVDKALLIDPGVPDRGSVGEGGYY
jgi:hypothetical protein